MVVVALLALDAWPAVQHHLFPTSPWVEAPVAHGGTVALGAPLTSYRVTYRVDAGVPVGRAVRTETLEVRRPWQSRLTTRPGPPPGRSVSEVRVGDFGKVDIRTTGQVESVLALPPDLAPQDLRLDADLPALRRARGLVAREQRTVLGRRCQVYRSTAPPQGQNVERFTTASADVVDSCVDRDGLVLEQLQLFKGKLLVRRRAVRVDTTPQFAADAFSITKAPTVPVSLGGGSVVAVDPASPSSSPGLAFVVDRVPDGFTYQGRYAVAPPAATSNGLPDASRRGGYTDVWVRGIDLLILDQGGTTYGTDPLGALPLGSKVNVGALGTAVAAPGARLSQVAVTLPGGNYVRVLGTIGLDQLTAVLGSVRRVSGGA